MKIDKGVQASESIAFGDYHIMFKSMVENLNDGFGVIDRQRRLIFANAKFATMIGDRVDELIGIDVLHLFDEENQQKLKEELRTRTRGESSAYEIVFTSKSGGKVPAFIRATPIFDARGVHMGSYAVITDLTTMKRVERELSAEKAKLENIVKGIGAGLSLLDSETKIVWANEILQKWFGPIEKIKGKPCYELYDLKDPQREYAALRTLRSGQIEQGEAFAYSIGGERRYFQLTTAPIKDADGRIVQMVELTEDITERKRMEEQIEDYARNLEAKVAEKTQELSKSEERYRNLVETSGDAIFVLNLDGTFAFINSWAEKLSGYSKEEALKTKFTDVLAPEYVESTVARFKRHMSDPSIYRYEIQIVAKGGRRIDLEVATTPLREGGKTIAIQGTAKDITERKRAEEVLRGSEARFRSVVESSTDAIILADGEGKIVSFNKGAENIFGYVADEVIGRPLKDLMPERYREAHTRALERANADGRVKYIGKSHELYGLRKNGSEFPLELNVAVWQLGEKTYSSGIIRDITERKRTEEELRSSREFMKNVLESSADAIITTNVDGIITSWSKGAEGIYGHRAEDMIGKSIYDLYPAPLREERDKWFNELIAGERVKDVRTQIYRVDGSLADITLSLALLRDSKGTLIGTVGVSKDITEHLKAEEALKESEEKYRNLVDNALVGVYKTNLKGGILYVNDALVRMLEFESPEELISGGALARYKNPKDRAVLIENLKKTGRVESFETEALTKTGKTKHVLFNATLEGDTLSGMILDITERKRSEEELGKAHAELQKKFAEQQKFMKFAVGRELKMIEFKNKIKELEQRLAEYGGRA